ncbi:MAG: permease [Alphaproteobacteria bacterium]
MTVRAATLALTGSLKGLDRVVAAILLLFAGLAVIVPGQAVASIAFTLESLVSVALFIALSVALAAAINASGADEQIARVLRGHSVRVIVIAAVFSALSPFCSCGVIPVIAALLAAGVPLAPVMAFWIGSPLMDPESFILTGAIIDVPFAIVRTASSIGVGLLAGFATLAAEKSGWLGDPMRAAKGCGSCVAKSVWSTDKEVDLARQSRIHWTFWREPRRMAVFLAQARTIGWFLFKWLTLAFALESLMVAYLPAEGVAALLGRNDWWVIPASALIGVPTYLNGYAALPLIDGLLDKGMVPGAALAFLTAGEITSVPAAMAVFVLVRRPVFAWYIGLGLAGSLVTGYAYQAFLSL